MSDGYLAAPITLEPGDYPAPQASMLSLVPADVTGTLQLGDPYLDAETVQALHDGVATGQFAVDPAWSEVLSVTSNAELETRFLDRLKRTPLSGATATLHHRRLALYEAVREIGAAHQTPGFGYGVHNITRCIGDLETWLEGKRQELEQLGLADAELARMLTMLTPPQLAAMLQTSETNLAQWRNSNVGPAYAKVSQRTIRYPVAAVLEWLRGAISR